ncbi:MAG: efflux RND transporter periplasmic adaptor subunit [Allomuricauda sp.]|jgi:HlyD family secretion protein|uniref:Efflux RND transporter periplasmic adaptor subunit n=1 Tax=Flagellimonas sp. MMG031 TaxID=3158549 RepID=A0AAU7N3J4_9FLAO|nr:MULTISPECIES: efflux RND transporter periplasmic adaptor subunit [unclassified Allomuricauda]MBO6533354.1 efflux RND transporter periplasmic adaptor subunit [Allomuricauda sp.]MBO6589869.1 efflux RND transporter periplasmic adaptor subunit [Allomuricauda sp.]MBO6619495.1 efflux RND transporter periplasmic adaptor subunit [Allomuricauda sp.]MBO6645536.1 efflux RND transporter periplasmic adaptor subunit [Allomuricauda sp.]MBO6747743.1 efflux RND transporter periplasmic adaptor subunit [Allom
MKKSVTIVILLLIVIVFGGSMYYLYQKNAEDPVVYETETPSKQTIVKKAVATGSILPLEEVLIKPNISGVIEEIYVEGGDYVKSGDLLAKIKVVPNLSALNDAKNAINEAKINLDDQKRNYERQSNLFGKGVIPKADLERAEVSYDQAKQAYAAANQRYDIVKTGTTSGLSNSANTLIRATVSGMVLEVPVEVGNQVIESNTFNEGTTIAAIADVDKMIFEGKVDESEVGKIKEDLPLEITVGAIENRVFNAVLDYIAPKGKEENGAIQFEIKGTLRKNDTVFIRAGLSANASIILARADSVLAVKEALVQFDDETKKPYVEVETADQQFERKEVELGVSDGIFVEVKSGLGASDKVKVWNALAKE